MLELTPETAPQYLCDRKLVKPPVTATALAWGVSNVVMRIEGGDGDRFVLKQSREQLRTRDAWFSRLDRIWRETGVLRLLGAIIPDIVPAIRYEDRDNYLFTMEAAPDDHVVWKQLLLEGQADPDIARQLGRILATVHRQTANRPDLQAEWGDTEVFIQLRVDPFYRRVADVHPQVRPPIEAMIAEMEGTSVCLVLADFSPKNVLVHSQGLTLVDFETGHYGDPAFDLGFFLSHLLLKASARSSRFDDYAALTLSFWETYWPTLTTDVPLAMHPGALFYRTLAHLGGCMLARVDGTSKVDYLTQPDAVRRVALSYLLDPPVDWREVLRRLKVGVS